MKIQFLGASETVTGSKTLISHDNKKFLVDCGLFQGYKNLRLKNWEALSIKANEVDAVILTHAHLDHSGYLPALVVRGFKGPVYCTPGTAQLLKILLLDSAKIQEEDAQYANRKGFSKHKPAKPLYTTEDVQTTLELIRVVPFNLKREIAPNTYIEFSPAGHIIGSAFVHFSSSKKSICFSGDLGRQDDDVMNPPAPLKYADALVLESTYGNRVHSKEHPEVSLAREILETIARGGDLLIPAFAVGRTQKVLYHIVTLMNQNIVPRIPIYMDSPMAINASEIFCTYHQEHKMNQKSCQLIFDKVIHARTQQDSMNIATTKGSKIIVSASGMATGGRVLHHLRRLLPDSNSTVLFSGYQAGGTRGAKLIAGEQSVKIHGEFVQVNARVSVVDSMSAHADSKELISWVKSAGVPPKKIFLNHGETSAIESLKDKLRQQVEAEILIPKEGQEFQI